MIPKVWIPIGFRLLSKMNSSISGRLAWELFCRPRRSPRPRDEELFWQTGEELLFSSGRRARKWGTGPTLFFVHGWESRGSAFHKLIPQVVEAGFQAISWDGPAHGDSPGTRTNMPHYAFCLADDIRTSSLNIHGFVGHSLGGAALGVLLPLISQPKCIAIISAPTRIEGVFRRFANFINLSEAASRSLVATAKEEVGFSVNDKSLVSLRLDQQVRVLCVHDSSDKEIPFEDFEILRQIWDKAQFHATRGLGHRRIIRNPEVAQILVQFLTDRT